MAYSPLAEYLHRANLAAAGFRVIGCRRRTLDDQAIDAETLKGDCKGKADRTTSDNENGNSSHVLHRVLRGSTNSDPILRQPQRQQDVLLIVRNGSKAALATPKSDFRFSPESGLNSDIAPCPKCVPKADLALLSLIGVAARRDVSAGRAYGGRGGIAKRKT
jgi:hypothetical protein